LPGQAHTSPSKAAPHLQIALLLGSSLLSPSDGNFLLSSHSACWAHCRACSSIVHFPVARPSRQQIASGPRILVGTPSTTLPLTYPARACPAPGRRAPCSSLQLGLGVRRDLYHRDSQVGASRGSTSTRNTAAMLGPTRAHRPFAGPKLPHVSSAVGRRAGQLLGWEWDGLVLGLLGTGTGTAGPASGCGSTAPRNISSNTNACYSRAVKSIFNIDGALRPFSSLLTI